MTEKASLQDALGESAHADDEPKAPEEQPKAEEPKGEEPNDVEKGDDQAPPADDIETLRAEMEALKSENTGLKSGISEERRKRQSLEDEHRFKTELESRKAEQPSAPDPWTEPDKALESVRSEWQQALLNERLNMSEAMARQSHGDEAVDAAAEAFLEATKANPEMYHAMTRQQNPYSYVVNWHKQQQTLKEVGSVDDLRAKIEAEVRAKLEAEAKANAQSMPPDLSQEPSGATPSQQWNGPRPLDEIIK